MPRVLPEPADVFLDHLKTMVKNLLINNSNYTTGYYYDLQKTRGIGLDEMIRDTKDRANHILEYIEMADHLVKEPDNVA